MKDAFEIAGVIFETAQIQDYIRKKRTGKASNYFVRRAIYKITSGN